MRSKVAGQSRIHGKEVRVLPVKGLSGIRRFPRVGKIRLGERAASERGSEYPRAAGHFVVKEDYATSAEAAAAFREVYGERPDTIDIMFPCNDPERFFPQWYKSYRASVGLWCKGDGENAIRRVEGGELLDIDCLGRACPYYEAGECREVANLMVLLPKVRANGVWQIDTSSFHSIVRINSSIELLRAETGGWVAMIPLKLRLVPIEVSPDGRKKIVRVLDLVLPPMTIEEIAALRRQAVPEIGVPEVNHEEIPEDLFPLPLVEAVQARERPNGKAAEENTPRAEEEPKPEPVPETLVRRIRAAARGAGLSEEDLAGLVRQTAGRDSRVEDLSREEAEDVMGEIKRRSMLRQAKPRVALPREVYQIAEAAGWSRHKAEQLVLSALAAGKGMKSVLEDLRARAARTGRGGAGGYYPPGAGPCPGGGAEGRWRR